MNWEILLEKVADQHTFLIFVKALIKDKAKEETFSATSSSNPYGSGAQGWENNTIASYLESCVAWTEDSLGRKRELSEPPSWRLFAEFLYAGKYYE